jgi:hypothetical protein
MRRLVFNLLIAAMAGAATACDERLSSIAGPTPSLEPTFASIQRNIFELRDSAGRANCTNCHNTASRAGGLNLDRDVAYDSLVNVASRAKPRATRVVPGDPDGSYLIQKVEGRADIVGSKMPLNGPYLSSGQILILRRWIEIGAPRN